MSPLRKAGRAVEPQQAAWRASAKRRGRPRLRRTILLVVLLAGAGSGCAPMYVGPPPPMGPPGSGSAPLLLPPAGSVSGTAGTGAGTAPPATFAPGDSTTGPLPGGTGSRSLNDVPDVAADRVLGLPPVPKASRWHEVRPGESLTSIARQYGVSVDALMTANFFDREPVLQPGQLILVP